MARPRQETPQQRKHRFEQFEQRLVMSAQAVAAVLPELDLASPMLTQQVVTHPLLNDVSETTQAADLADQYGFDGSGQTVAVIDSGIAWDHYALGGGYGEGNKVVGGWDFAENDANPYDDGPAGFHGSHVAGIIGSEDDQYRGVSSGVDLVALRVFDDYGGGDLARVEQALQWVHEHKDDFASPITTVNLSLGTEWNAFDVPEWATLEDEFAQLEADGMFISVAAGNAFRSFGTQGLSYPAVSEHVVPVASHDADGELSDFSQRAENVLVAPGERIKSTVPDHLFGGSSHDRFLGSTGTSMSAPYVAGASAILRQANEFMGVTNVDQDMLYQQFRDTADQIFDSVTGGYYYKINLEAALSAVVTDLHSNTADGATDVGELAGGESILGTIGKISDVDHFAFTAAADGTVRFQFDVTNDMTPQFAVAGSAAEFNGNEVAFAVEAGKQYKFSVGSGTGNGRYEIDVQFEEATTGSDAAGDTDPGTDGETEKPVIDWGTVSSSDFVGQTIDGQSTYQLAASQSGFLTLQVDNQSGENMAVEIYDSQDNLLAASSTDDGQIRVDIVVQEGETYLVKAVGNATDVKFSVDNLVSLENGQLAVNGTTGDDLIEVNAQQKDRLEVFVNGLHYGFDLADIETISVDGQQGTDQIELNFGALNERGEISRDAVFIENSEFKLNATNFHFVNVTAGGGYNAVTLVDTAGDDVLHAALDSTTMTGAGYSNTVSDFDLVRVSATQGNDSVHFQGTQRSERLMATGSNVTFYSSSVIMADSFDTITVNGGGGSDRANLFGTSASEQFVLSPNEASVTGADYQLTITGIATISAYNSGNDTLSMTDSSGNDRLSYDSGHTSIRGDGYQISGAGFSQTEVVSVGGYDTANINDTAGNDVFTADGDVAEFQSRQFQFKATGFENVNMNAVAGGTDRATLVGTYGRDTVNATDRSVQLRTSDNLTTRVTGFDEVDVDTRGGNDVAYLVGSQQDDRLQANYSDIEFETTLQMLQLVNTEKTEFDGNGGIDQVSIEGFEELDLLSSIGDRATAYLKDHSITAVDFDVLEARTVDGAIADYDLEAIDYLYMLRGKWKNQ